MITLTPGEARLGGPPRSAGLAREAHVPLLRWPRGGGFLLLLLAGYLLFCHGCHGDEDNELFTALGLYPQAAREEPAKGRARGTGPLSRQGPRGTDTPRSP
jgi:hypothetical protein